MGRAGLRRMEVEFQYCALVSMVETSKCQRSFYNHHNILKV